MSAFADTSFLFAFYFPRSESAEALAMVQAMGQPAIISPLIRFEFQQAVWFKVWLQTQGQPLGLSETAALSALAAFELDIEQGLWQLGQSDLDAVLLIAQRLVTDYTVRTGARALDILHVATALHVGASQLLSFDENQRRVAAAENLAFAP